MGRVAEPDPDRGEVDGSVVAFVVAGGHRSVGLELVDGAFDKGCAACRSHCRTPVAARPCHPAAAGLKRRRVRRHWVGMSYDGVLVTGWGAIARTEIAALQPCPTPVTGA